MICSAQAYCAAVYAANPLHGILQRWIKATKACAALAKTSNGGSFRGLAMWHSGRFQKK